MLTNRQTITLLVLSLLLWILATLSIRLMPDAFADPLRGTVGFALSLPAGWASIRLTGWFGRLSRDQLLPGVVIVGAVAMMIDGAALRWLPGVYGADALVHRLGAAWLLWGYGVSLVTACLMTARSCKNMQA
jgi:hypothetical protein